jgi:hypothetical protein
VDKNIYPSRGWIKIYPSNVYVDKNISIRVVKEGCNVGKPLLKKFKQKWYFEIYHLDWNIFLSTYTLIF